MPLSVVTQSILLQPAMGLYVCSHVALSLRIMFNVCPVLLSPRRFSVLPSLSRGRRDHVDVGWFQRMCHMNGVEVTCVLCVDSMGDDRVAVPCCNQEVHVGCLAQFQCLWGEMPILRATIARVC